MKMVRRNGQTVKWLDDFLSTISLDDFGNGLTILAKWLDDLAMV